MKIRALLLSLFLLFPLLLLSPPKALATENTVSEAKEDLIGGLADILPDAAKESLGTSAPDANAIREAVGFRHIFSLAADALSGALSNGGTAGKLFGTALLFSAASLVGSFFGKSRFAEIFFSAAPALLFYRLLSSTLSRVFSFLTELSTFSSLLSPLYVSVFSASGAVGSAAAASSGFTVFVGILESVVLGLLSPLLKILFALSLLSPFSFSSLTAEIEKRIRASFVWILSVICFFLCASLAFESGLASSADSVAMRAAKFTVGESIPLVGGAISSMLGTLSSSLSLVKSTFGAGALVALLSLLLPVLAELVVLRISLSLSSLAATAMGAGSVGSICERYRGVLDLMLAAVAITGVMFLILVGIFSRLGTA